MTPAAWSSRSVRLVLPGVYMREDSQVEKVHRAFMSFG
jgi:hypothetical protein